MPHVRPEDVFVVGGDGYSVWGRAQTVDEVVALGAIG
jgi:hypothetical protein